MFIHHTVLFYWLVHCARRAVAVRDCGVCGSAESTKNTKFIQGEYECFTQSNIEYYTDAVQRCACREVKRNQTESVCCSVGHNNPQSKHHISIDSDQFLKKTNPNTKESVAESLPTTVVSVDDSSLSHVLAEYGQSSVASEFIVVFVGYYTTAARYSFIRAALREFNSSLWTVAEHSEFVAGWPSDFDVVRFTFGCGRGSECGRDCECGEMTSPGDESSLGSERRCTASGPAAEVAAVLALREHRCVRSVSQQQRVSRVLHFLNTSTDIPAPGEGHEYSADGGGQEASWSDLLPDGGGSRRLMAALSSAGDGGQRALLHEAQRLWREIDERGQSVRVAVFDTGLNSGHAHFGTRVRERTSWTDEKRVVDDVVGHGTFIAGVIAGGDARCPGLAPEAQLYIYRVFSRKQTSYTSWFLDAFNHAIARRVHVLNLSIGGTDFTDTAFVNKVRQVTGNGVVMVSAIGNDGPLYGTCNNPGDQSDVIGVGATGATGPAGALRLARFSSRGMTTWELPAGYGRLKPDLVAPGVRLRGSSVDGGCRTLSGTSMAAPLVAGAAVLLVDALRRDVTNTSSSSSTPAANPASIKQALLASARRLPAASMFEQGAGQLQLLAARLQLLRQQRRPALSASPAYLDLTECPYMWPFCSQPLYHSARPLLANITLLNPRCVRARVQAPPVWRPDPGTPGSQWLQVAVSYSPLLWPWSGWLAVWLSVAAEARHWQGVVRGRLSVTVECLAGGLHNVSAMGAGGSSSVSIPVRVRVTATPPRSRRILWDQFHSLRYPDGYFPRDWLASSGEGSQRVAAGGFATGAGGGGLLDWLGDHVHTNFGDMYQALRSAGYYMEVLGEPLSCFDASLYGTLMLVDTEDEFFDQELVKLHSDVEELGLSLLVFADWYNVSVMRRVRFYDENGRRWRLPVTGGANVPGLNRLLAPWDVALGGRVLSGPMTTLFSASIANNNNKDQVAHFASGVPLVRFPAHGVLVRQTLRDQGAHIVDAARVEAPEAPVLGFLQTRPDLGRPGTRGGRIVVFGDSDCLDSSRGVGGDCFSLLTALLQYATTGQLPSTLRTESLTAALSDSDPLPQSPPDSQLHQYSRVLDPLGDGAKQRPIPACGSVLDPTIGASNDGVLQWARVSLQEAVSSPEEEDTADYLTAESIESLASFLSLPPRPSTATLLSKLPVNSSMETSYWTPLAVLLVCGLVLFAFWYRLRSSRGSKSRHVFGSILV